MTLSKEALQQLIEHNCYLLDELCQAISTISDQTYAHANPNQPANSIANHIRHICEHYTCLFTAIKQWHSRSLAENETSSVLLIDYDARPRDNQAFSTRTSANEAISNIMQCLKALVADTNLPSQIIQVAMSTFCNATSIQAPSTIYRELQFLHGHSVHHLAVISLLLQQVGIEMPRSFGTAASTLKFESQR